MLLQPSSQSTTDDAEATTTVQFIAVSAEEHQRMINSGELPVSVQGADVHMQIPGAEAQQVLEERMLVNEKWRSHTTLKFTVVMLSRFA